MSEQDGKLPPDPNLLTPNDLRRARVALGGGDPLQMLNEHEDRLQLFTYCYASRSRPALTWEQAGDIPVGEVLDLSRGDEDGPPPTPPPERSGSSGGPTTAPTSKRKRSASDPAPSSAPTTG